MAGKPIEIVAHVWNPKHIYHCGSMVFPGIAIDANREATAIMVDNTSKDSCGLNRNPASMPGL